MEELLKYDGLIHSIINKYPNRFDREELYQVSMIGLVDAYHHYDQKYQTKFSSFAYYYIVGEINKYIRESSGIKISKDLVRLKKKVLEAKEMLEQKLGREPSTVEISLFLDIDDKLIDDALLATDEIENLDDEINFIHTFDNTCAELLDLRDEIDKLPDDEKQIIIARYYQELTQMETSKILGISQVQVSRKESKILQKLKEQL